MTSNAEWALALALPVAASIYAVNEMKKSGQVKTIMEGIWTAFTAWMWFIGFIFAIGFVLWFLSTLLK